jgi:hypothetical protein
VTRADDLDGGGAEGEKHFREQRHIRFVRFFGSSGPFPQPLLSPHRCVVLLQFRCRRVLHLYLHSMPALSVQPKRDARASHMGPA